MLQVKESVKATEQRVAGCEVGGVADVSRAELQANRHGFFRLHLQPAAGKAQYRHSYIFNWRPCSTLGCQHHSKKLILLAVSVCVFILMLFVCFSSIQLTVNKDRNEDDVDDLQPRQHDSIYD